jgi:hypothetical protein
MRLAQGLPFTCFSLQLYASLGTLSAFGFLMNAAFAQNWRGGDGIATMLPHGSSP